MRPAILPSVLAIVALASGLLFGSTWVGAADCPYASEGSVVYWEGAWGPEFASHDFPLGLVGAERLPSGNLLYEVPLFTLVPLFQDREVDVSGEGGARRYNLRWVSSLAAFGLARLLHGGRAEEGESALTGDGLRVVSGPLSYLLHAPNFSLKGCVTEYFRLTVGTRSDLLPYRLEWGERGVLLTPKAGLELSAGHMDEGAMARITAEAGYGSWWNWDGPDRTTGWRVVLLVSLYVSR